MKKVKLLAIILLFTLFSSSLTDETESYSESGDGADDYEGSGEEEFPEEPAEPEVKATKVQDTMVTKPRFEDEDDDSNKDVIFETGQTNNEPEIKTSENHDGTLDRFSFNHPAVLALIIGGVIFVLLIVLLLIMFVVYRLRKKDEGSYALDENMKKKSQNIVYTKAPQGQNEFFA